MLNLLGTIGSNILSLPGILGLAAGMTTRNLPLAAGMGAVIGIAETLIFAGFDFGKIEALELIVSVGVGLMAGVLGCAIRIKGTTV